MNGRQAKKVRHLARAVAAKTLLEQTVVRRRWWLSALYFLLPVFAWLGINVSEELCVRIVRRGTYAEVLNR